MLKKIRIRDKQNLAYYEMGQGQPLIFLHGWALSHEIFLEAITAFSKHYRCIALDWPGFGDSDPNPLGFQQESIVEDFDLFLKALQIENSILCGYSMGASLALAYLSTKQGISKLILLSAAAPRYVRSKDYPYGLRMADVKALADLLQTDRQAAIHQFATLFSGSVSDSFRRTQLQTWSEKADSETLYHSLCSLSNWDLRSHLAQVKLPCLLLHGKKDWVCPSIFSEILNQGIADSRILLFENASHDLLREKENLYQAMMDFLKA